MGHLIMFDFDGVVADSFEVFYAEFRAAVEDLGFHKLQTRNDLLGLFEGNAFVQLVKLGFPVWRLKRLGERFGPRIAEANQRVHPFPGMPELLAELAAEHTVYVISSNTTKAVEDFLQKHQIAGVCDVLGADKERSKVKKIRQTMKQHPGSTPWYVGDTKGDMLEGREAGAATIAVTWGWHSEERLRTGNPDHVVHSQDELKRLFA